MSLHCAAETYIKIKVPGADGAEGKAMSFMYFLAVLIGPLVKILYSFIGNYAATMIVATLILKLLLFPLSIHQQKSTAKMSVFQPLITEIQQKYKNDPQKQQEELMKLQQEHGYNPMGGCMPMLLTMLVLFGFLGVVYYPVHYIFGVSNEAVKAACEAIGLATTNTSTMQTALIQAIHNGASIDPSIISASVVAEIQNFNTSFFGMDMCDVPGFHLTPIAIFPAIATVTMFVSYFIIINIVLSGRLFTFYARKKRCVSLYFLSCKKILNVNIVSVAFCTLLFYRCSCLILNENINVISVKFISSYRKFLCFRLCKKFQSCGNCCRILIVTFFCIK